MTADLRERLVLVALTVLVSATRASPFTTPGLLDPVDEGAKTTPEGIPDAGPTFSPFAQDSLASQDSDWLSLSDSGSEGFTENVDYLDNDSLTTFYPTSVEITLSENSSSVEHTVTSEQPVNLSKSIEIDEDEIRGIIRTSLKKKASAESDIDLWLPKRVLEIDENSIVSSIRQRLQNVKDNLPPGDGKSEGDSAGGEVTDEGEKVEGTTEYTEGGVEILDSMEENSNFLEEEQEQSLEDGFDMSLEDDDDEGVVDGEEEEGRRKVLAAEKESDKIEQFEPGKVEENLIRLQGYFREKRKKASEEARSDEGGVSSMSLWDYLVSYMTPNSQEKPSKTAVVERTISHPCDSINGNYDQWLQDALRRKVLVVGGGVAGLATLRTLSGIGVDDVLLLEATNRLGGRIRTVRHDKWMTEEGINVIQGEENNPVFIIARELGLLGSPVKQPNWEETTVTSDGDKMRSTSVRKGASILQQLRQDEAGKRALSIYGERPFGDFFLNRFQEMWGSAINEKDKQAWMFYVHQMVAQQYGGNWMNISARDVMNFDHRGYDYIWQDGMDGFVRFLVGEIAPQQIKPDAPICQIFWDLPDGGSLAVAADGTSYHGQYLVLAMPLALLKERHYSTFVPPLPRKMSRALSAFEAGVVNRVALAWDSPWWLGGDMELEIMWKDYTFPPEMEWMSNIVRIRSTPHNTAQLEMLVTGEASLVMEELSAETVISHIMTLLRAINRQYTVPLPIFFHRSQWSKSLWARSSYQSHMTMEGVRMGIRNRDVLCPRLSNTRGRKSVFFAGEHTSSDRFGTVDGAFISGVRAAKWVMDELVTQALKPYQGHGVEHRFPVLSQDNINFFDLFLNPKHYYPISLIESAAMVHGSRNGYLGDQMAVQERSGGPILGTTKDGSVVYYTQSQEDSQPQPSGGQKYKYVLRTPDGNYVPVVFAGSNGNSEPVLRSNGNPEPMLQSNGNRQYVLRSNGQEIPFVLTPSSSDNTPHKVSTENGQNIRYVIAQNTDQQKMYVVPSDKDQQVPVSTSNGQQVTYVMSSGNGQQVPYVISNGNGQQTSFVAPARSGEQHTPIVSPMKGPRVTYVISPPDAQSSADNVPQMHSLNTQTNVESDSMTTEESTSPTSPVDSDSLTSNPGNVEVVYVDREGNRIPQVPGDFDSVVKSFLRDKAEPSSEALAPASIEDSNAEDLKPDISYENVSRNNRNRNRNRNRKRNKNRNKNRRKDSVQVETVEETGEEESLPRIKKDTDSVEEGRSPLQHITYNSPVHIPFPFFPYPSQSAHPQSSLTSSPPLPPVSTTATTPKTVISTELPDAFQAYNIDKRMSAHISSEVPGMHNLPGAHPYSPNMNPSAVNLHSQSNFPTNMQPQLNTQNNFYQYHSQAPTFPVRDIPRVNPHRQNLDFDASVQASIYPSSHSTPDYSLHKGAATNLNWTRPYDRPFQYDGYPSVTGTNPGGFSPSQDRLPVPPFYQQERPVSFDRTRVFSTQIKNLHYDYHQPPANQPFQGHNYNTGSTTNKAMTDAYSSYPISKQQSLEYDAYMSSKRPSSFEYYRKAPENSGEVYMTNNGPPHLNNRGQLYPHPEGTPNTELPMRYTPQIIHKNRMPPSSTQHMFSVESVENISGFQDTLNHREHFKRIGITNTQDLDHSSGQNQTSLESALGTSSEHRVILKSTDTTPVLEELVITTGKPQAKSEEKIKISDISEDNDSAANESDDGQKHSSNTLPLLPHIVPAMSALPYPPVIIQPVPYYNPLYALGHFPLTRTELSPPLSQSSSKSQSPDTRDEEQTRSFGLPFMLRHQEGFHGVIPVQESQTESESPSIEDYLYDISREIISEKQSGEQMEKRKRNRVRNKQKHNEHFNIELLTKSLEKGILEETLNNGTPTTIISGEVVTKEPSSTQRPFASITDSLTTIPDNNFTTESTFSDSYLTEEDSLLPG